MKARLFGLIGLLLAPCAAMACTLVPPTTTPAPPSQQDIDSAARAIFAEASVIAEITVVRPVRPLLPGLIRIDRLIKGEAPEYLEIPLPDPCLSHYQRVGEHAVVSVYPGGSPGAYLPEFTIASMRRQGLGNWRR